MTTRLLLMTIVGVVLLGYCHCQRRLPVLPAQFTLSMEIIDFNSKTIYSTKEVFDYEGKLARTDMIPPPKSDLERQFGSRPITLVSDFKTGNRYVIDRWARNCTQLAVAEHSWVAETGTDNFVHMKHSYDIFDRIKSPDNYKYMGETTMRNISVVEWKKLNSDSNESIYILQRDWKSNSEWSISSITDIPVGLKITQYNNQTAAVISEQIIDIYDFYSGHPERTSFDVGDCFSFYAQYKSLLFLLQGSYMENVYGKHEQVYTAVANAIARHAKISTLRITDLYLGQKFPLLIDVIFMIQEKPRKQNDVPNPVSEPTLDEAFENLKKAISDGFSIPVPYKQGSKDLGVIKSSLALRNRWYSDPVDDESQMKTYTPGSMAGLGIGMLLLGCVLGMAGAFFIYKRLNTAVPYKISE